MIEEWRIDPLSFRVTVSTLLAERAFVGLVLEVTGRAIVAGGCFENRLKVAIIAGNRDV